MARKKKQKAKRVSHPAPAHARKEHGGAPPIAASPYVEEKPRYSLVSHLLDRQSFLFGIAAGILLIAIIWFAFFASSQPLSQPQRINSTPPAPAPPLQLIANSRLPTSFQIVVKNTDSSRMDISGLQIGEKDYNLTASLAPGEMRTISLSLPPCALRSPYDCPVTIIYTGQNGNGSTEQSASGSGQQQGNSSQGGSNETITTPPVPLGITTEALAGATQDQHYSFSLEAIGGTGHYSWSASGLPVGLSMGTGGVISGAPLEPGSFTISLTVDDGASSVSLDMPLIVNSR